MPSLFRFGEFEADTQTAELRKNGDRIKLQEQPFQVLAALLNHPYEVVTREALQKRLWPDGTFVDFDRGLNKKVIHIDADPMVPGAIYKTEVALVGDAKIALQGLFDELVFLKKSFHGPASWLEISPDSRC